jgi:hypothetical protein
MLFIAAMMVIYAVFTRNPTTSILVGMGISAFGASAERSRTFPLIGQMCIGSGLALSASGVIAAAGTNPTGLGIISILAVATAIQCPKYWIWMTATLSAAAALALEILEVT